MPPAQAFQPLPKWYPRAERSEHVVALVMLGAALDAVKDAIDAHRKSRRCECTVCTDLRGVQYAIEVGRDFLRGWECAAPVEAEDLTAAVLQHVKKQVAAVRR